MIFFCSFLFFCKNEQKNGVTKSILFCSSSKRSAKWQISWSAGPGLKRISDSRKFSLEFWPKKGGFVHFFGPSWGTPQLVSTNKRKWKISGPQAKIDGYLLWSVIFSVGFGSINVGFGTDCGGYLLWSVRINVGFGTDCSGYLLWSVTRPVDLRRIFETKCVQLPIVKCHISGAKNHKKMRTRQRQPGFGYPRPNSETQ